MGITAHIVAVGNYWNNFANAQVPVTDSNINQNVGNSITSVHILDGFYGMQAWIHADGSDVGYMSVGATCYEYAQDCGP